MRFYLSSSKLGEKAPLLAELYGNDRPVAYIANALDHAADKGWLEAWIADEIQELNGAGLRAEHVDLRDFFQKGTDFRDVAAKYSGVWMSGGNVFVLRQAMTLSGLDAFILENQKSDNFTYGGYSAACCVLSPSLKAFAIADDPSVLPYPEITEMIWDGLGILDFAFMPHYQPEHPDWALFQKEVAICSANNMPYRTFRDGEVLVL